MHLRQHEACSPLAANSSWIETMEFRPTVAGLLVHVGPEPQTCAPTPGLPALGAAASHSERFQAMAHSPSRGSEGLAGAPGSLSGLRTTLANAAGLWTLRRHPPKLTALVFVAPDPLTSLSMACARECTVHHVSDIGMSPGNVLQYCMGYGLLNRAPLFDTQPSAHPCSQSRRRTIARNRAANRQALPGGARAGQCL